MSKKILFSVIIPVYNLESYIGETLDSIINQNYNDFELIIVNDGSKDNTENVIREKLNNVDFKWKLINQENKGVSVARNKGIKEAQGEYIYFLDGDDTIANNFFNELKKAIEKTNNDIYFFGIQKYYRDKIIFEYTPQKKYGKPFPSNKILKDYLNLRIFINIWSIIIKSNIIKNNNLLFTPGIKHGEDREFIIKCLYHSRNVYGLDKILFFYRKRDNSADTKEFSIEKFHSIAGVKNVIIYLKKINAEQSIIDGIENILLPRILLARINELVLSERHENLYFKIIGNDFVKHIFKNIYFKYYLGNHFLYFIKYKFFVFFPKLYKYIIKIRSKYVKFI